MPKPYVSLALMLLLSCSSAAPDDETTKGSNEEPGISTVPAGGQAGSPPPGAECESDAECDGFYCADNECVAGLACASRAVSCTQPRPQCPIGKVASVIDGCWSDCVNATQCADVDDCDMCAATDVCIRTEFEGGASGFVTRSSCAPPPPDCSDRDCDCFGSLCTVAACGAVEGDVVICSTTISTGD